MESKKFHYDRATAQPLSKKIASILIDFYTSLLSKFSIDEQRHYLFTPRTLTQIVFGLLTYDGLDQSDLLSEILSYELSRSFRDRLVSLESQSKFDNILSSLFKSHLKTGVDLTNVFFSSIAGESIVKANLSKYEKKDYIALIKQGIINFEREFKELKLLLLDEVLKLLASLDRSLARSKSLLLAGRSGSARKSCSQLAALMIRLEFLTPAVSKDYGIREFKKVTFYFYIRN